MKRLCVFFVLLLPAGAQPTETPVARLLRTGVVSSSAVDSAGFLYVAGRTVSSDFPATAGSFQPQFRRTVCGSDDAGDPFFCGDTFVAKLDVERQQIVWATFLGGASDDCAWSIQLDLARSVYVVGTTWSADFPVTAGALQSAYGGPTVAAFRRRVDPGGDLFVAKLSPQGGRLEYATYFGGPTSEASPVLRVDSSGQAFVAGNTSGTVQVSSEAYLTAPTGDLGITSFAFKLTADARLAYATYLPAGKSSIDTDGNGNLYVTGSASSGLTATAGAYQASPGGLLDAWLLKLNAAGTRALYATWIGGSRPDRGSDVRVGPSGDAWVAGSTESPEIREDNSSLVSSGFLMQFSPDGSRITFRHFLEPFWSPALRLSNSGDLFWTGSPQTRALPTTSDALLGGGCDPMFNTYLLRVAPDGRIRTATYLPPGQILGIEADTVYYSSGDGVSRLPLVGPAAAQVFCAVHAATFAVYPGVAPGQLLTLFGAGLGPDTAVGLTVGSDGKVEKQAGGTTVTFDGVAAPITYAHSKQINLVAPFSVAGKQTVHLSVRSRSGTVSLDLPVIPVHPGLFTRNSVATGQAAALNQDGTVNAADNPAALGSIISLFLTGAGAMQPEQQDGEITGLQPSVARLPLRVFITGPREAEVLWAGAAPGLIAGVVQINARLPQTIDPSTPASAMPIWIQVGDSIPTFFGAKVAVR